MSADNPAAPGDLEQVRRFVNTLDIEGAVDDIATAHDLVTWLRQQSLLAPGAKANYEQVQLAHSLRESLRECLLANHDRLPPPPSARAVLNDIARDAELTLTLDADGHWRARPRAAGIAGALGRLVVTVADSMTAGDWQRLKACLNDTCHWAFYDHSRARNGRWCSMQVCGNRSKQHAWRQRSTPKTTAP